MDLCRGLLFSWPLPWSVSHKNHFHAALVLKTLCYSLQMRNQIHLLHSRECRPLNKSLLSTCSVLGMEPAPPPRGDGREPDSPLPRVTCVLKAEEHKRSRKPLVWHMGSWKLSRGVPIANREQSNGVYACRAEWLIQNPLSLPPAHEQNPVRTQWSPRKCLQAVRPAWHLTDPAALCLIKYFWLAFIAKP